MIEQELIRPSLAFGLVILIGASLSACNQKAGSDVAKADPYGSSARPPEDQFGKEFGEAFRAPPNSEPANVTDGAMVPVSTTAEPVQIE